MFFKSSKPVAIKTLIAFTNKPCDPCFLGLTKVILQTLTNSTLFKALALLKLHVKLFLLFC